MEIYIDKIDKVCDRIYIYIVIDTLYLLLRAHLGYGQELDLKELVQSLDVGGLGYVGWVQWTAVALTAMPVAAEPLEN